ncbi:transmembrane sensor [Catalinimonas alkaloidigena]|uniref:FecR family protein n=1 Tax=Catalinimonas alkaloidigena TaxID=1075417 RepID=UPI00240724EA|nr:FecR domain-containing protein [Catalinimonas alkaloidigena]MDF9798975.1 transmembrane sensor [Catalinimonas alkaloidigena]
MIQNENKYDHYQAEDFAQDERFIAWVRTGAAVEDGFWEAWCEAHPEKNEEIIHAKALVQLMQAPEREPSEIQIESLWKQISEGMGSQAEAIKPSTGLWQLHRWKFAAAAMITVLLISFFLLRSSSETIRAAQGQQLSYTLPDKSVVTLNAGSEITFDPTGWEDQRKLHLVGEAFFEVEKGSSFRVSSPNGTVEVLGTSFNVYARGQKLEVACLTGKVKVSDTEGNVAQLLSPGKGVLLTQHEVQPFDIDVEEGVGWRRGEFIFEDVPLVEVLEELKRQYKLKVILQADVLGRKYSGQFTNHDLDGALQMICLPMELTYELDSANNKVIIRQE